MVLNSVAILQGSFFELPYLNVPVYVAALVAFCMMCYNSHDLWSLFVPKATWSLYICTLFCKPFARGGDGHGNR